MKKKVIELDVDYIGDQSMQITKEEEQKISEFIKTDKKVEINSSKRKKAI